MNMEIETEAVLFIIVLMLHEYIKLTLMPLLNPFALASLAYSNAVTQCDVKNSSMTFIHKINH